MEPSTIKKLSRYLNEDQLKVYLASNAYFLAYIRSKSQDDLDKYKAAHAEFLELTNGKQPCELIPLSIW
jgi:hypothetical protein